MDCILLRSVKWVLLVGFLICLVVWLANYTTSFALPAKDKL